MAVKIDGTLGIDKVKDGSIIGSSLNSSIAIPSTATLPTAPASSNNSQLANTAYVDGKMVLGTSVATTSGTAIDFTGIPSWVKRVTIMFNGVSVTATSQYVIRIGDSAVSTSGYEMQGGLISVSSSVTAASATSGFTFNGSSSDTDTLSGSIVLNKVTSNKWVINGQVSSYPYWNMFVAGKKELSSDLTMVRVTTLAGTATFDAGSINIMYEG
jgi:hypothetical protein